MSLRWMLAALVSALIVEFGQAQYPVETAEPPLADGSEAQNAPPPHPGAAAAPRLFDGTAPLVQLSVRAPRVHAAGNPVPVKLIVENQARSPARNVVVFYPLGGATVSSATPEATPVADGVTWKFDLLPAASRKEITLNLTPAANAAELAHKPRITFEFEATPSTTRFAKPELRLRKYGPAQALKHDILVMSIDVTNAGSAEVADIQVVDALPDGLEHRPDDPPSAGHLPSTKPPSEISADRKSRTFKIGRLAPGQSRRVEYYVVAVGTAGSVVHQATATAPGLAEPVKAESRVTITEPKLELIAETPPRHPANRPARIVIRLTNRSMRTLANIVVNDRAAGGAVLESPSYGGQAFDGRAQWIVPMLAPNETRVFETVVRCPKGGQVTHQISAVYRGLTQGTQVATEFEAIAAVQWDFRGSTHAVEQNGEVQYILTIRNNGSAPATNVRPAIVVPPALQILKTSPAVTPDSGRAVFESATIPPGGRLVCSLTAKALQTVVAAHAVGEVAADEFTAGPVRKQESITVGGNDLASPTVSPTPAPALPTPAPPPKPK